MKVKSVEFIEDTALGIPSPRAGLRNGVTNFAGQFPNKIVMKEDYIIMNWAFISESYMNLVKLLKSMKRMKVTYNEDNVEELIIDKSSIDLATAGRDAMYSECQAIFYFSRKLNKINLFEDQ